MYIHATNEAVFFYCWNEANKQNMSVKEQRLKVIKRFASKNHFLPSFFEIKSVI
jgi:hypothetical protein